ncbi:MAG TPA: hypothetical protein VJU16_06340 [Planctomycetota bacterium]|nr:hypothetical protein [Planctomycetota bacterium]
MKALLHIIPRELTLQECDEWRRIIPLPESYDGVLERTHQWDAHVVVNVLSGSMDRFWHAWREAKRGRWEGGFQRRLADPLVKLDGVLALEELRRIRDIVGKPYPVARGELQSMWREWHARSRGWNPVRAVFVIPHSFYLDRVQISRAASTLIRTGLDWEKARIDTGKYPERCDVIDPLTGEPLVHDAKLGRLTIKGVEGFGSIQPFHWSFRK